MNRVPIGDDSMTIPARYEKGVFRPLLPVRVQEGAIVEIHLPPETLIGDSQSVADSPFAGMWKDRQDVAEGIEYVNRLRRELHG